MKYRFKPLAELYWAVVTSGSIVLLTALVTLDPESVKDWRAWAVALGGATVRAGAGAALDWVRRSLDADPEPTLADEILALSDTDLAALRVELDYRRNRPPPPPPPPAWSNPNTDVRSP